MQCKNTTFANAVNSIVGSFPNAFTAAWVCSANFKPIMSVEQLDDLLSSAKGVISIQANRSYRKLKMFPFQ